MSDLLPEQEPPEQPKAYSDDTMDVKLTCDPPLGQATTISKVSNVLILPSFPTVLALHASLPRLTIRNSFSDGQGLTPAPIG